MVFLSYPLLAASGSKFIHVRSFVMAVRETAPHHECGDSA